MLHINGLTKRYGKLLAPWKLPLKSAPYPDYGERLRIYAV